MSVGVIGLGYVGLPLAHAFWRAGINTIGFDIDPTKIEKLSRGDTYIKHFPAKNVTAMNVSGRFRATVDITELAKVDAILICVPTPMNATREPDLDFVVATAKSIKPHLRPGMLVLLESTAYPSTTTEAVQPILEGGGLNATSEFLLAVLPEREDPGNRIKTSAIPKIVGGVDAEAGELSAAFYGQAFSKVHMGRRLQQRPPTFLTGLQNNGGFRRSPPRNRPSRCAPRWLRTHAGCSTRAERRINRRGSNCHWMKSQWQVAI